MGILHQSDLAGDLFCRSCITRVDFRHTPTEKTAVYYEVNEDFEDKCNTKATLLDDFYLLRTILSVD